MPNHSWVHVHLSYVLFLSLFHVGFQYTLTSLYSAPTPTQTIIICRLRQCYLAIYMFPAWTQLFGVFSCLKKRIKTTTSWSSSIPKKGPETLPHPISHLSWPLISSQGITASLFEGLSGGHLELNEGHGVHEGSIECTDPANSGDHFGPHFVDWVVWNPKVHMSSTSAHNLND